MNSHFQRKLTKLSVTQVPADGLDLTPGPFTMSYGFSLESLQHSLKKVGLLNPPLLLESREGALDIIAGYRRIAALIELGHKNIPCRILKGHDLSPLDALLTSFYDNLATREFNPVEKGMVLRRLSYYLSGQEILSNYMVLLDLPAHQSTLETYISFDKDLDISIKEDLACGSVSEQTARALLGMVPGERRAVGDLFSKIKFNINQQKQLIELLIDISRITGDPIAKTLGEEQFQGILSSHSLNMPQKGRALLGLLRRKRFPTVTHAEETFKSKISRFHLPGNIRIQAPPYFESNYYRMEILFKNGVELKETIDHLSGLKGLQSLKDPWEGSD